MNKATTSNDILLFYYMGRDAQDNYLVTKYCSLDAFHPTKLLFLFEVLHVAYFVLTDNSTPRICKWQHILSDVGG